MRFLKAVEKASTHKTLEVCSRKWERFDAELAAACFRFASGEVLRKLKMYRDTLQRRGLDVSGRAALWFVLQNMLSKLERFSRSDCQDSLDSLSLATLVSSLTA